MSAVIIDLKSAEDPRDVVHRAVEALSAGKVIAFPTETVYGLAASALHPEAVQKLVATKGRSPDKPLAFAIKSVDDALDYVPNMSALGRRVARRSWPGPVTLVLDADHPDSVIHRLDESVRQATVPNGTVGLRVPAHELTLQIMRLCAGPIVLTSANLSGDPDPTNGQMVADSLGDQVDLILDDGPTKFGMASTVVQIRKDKMTILREGVVKENTVKRLTNFIALVVCTGNTCRSPMGEGLLKKRIAERLGCSIDMLEQQGVAVISAGIAAMPGSPAAAQAVEVMNRMGIDIADHSSQPITGRLAQFADVILTMTNGHRQALVSHWPTLETRTKTVRRDGADVSDPIGHPVEVYESTAKQIDAQWVEWVKEFELPPID
ncbi:MAG: tRNA threonylcarbamoyl adenosine modification protein (Sua5/YciO/YrdC/YwlC family) [Mariniblastus sp.]|jgi:tRNA threonylcarbamoyl adenosine modification protein (Sua5/YciO/YrdC/YwlC family)